MRNRYVVVVCLVMLLAVIACGPPTAPSEPTLTEEPATTQPEATQPETAATAEIEPTPTDAPATEEPTAAPTEEQADDGPVISTEIISTFSVAPNRTGVYFNGLPDVTNGFTYNGEAGQVVTFTVTPDSADFDPRIRLVDEDYEPIMDEQNNAGPGQPEVLTYTLPAAGRYSVLVYGEGIVGQKIFGDVTVE